MSLFIQLHLLTSYPPANLNRDDLGRPKTAVMGGTQRLRISSQSLKRAWRTSDLFKESLKGHLGTRTKETGVQVFKVLKEKGVSEAKAKKWAQQIAEVFGKLKAADKNNPLVDLEVEQLIHFSPEELRAIDELIDKLAQSDKDPTEQDLRLLRKEQSAADIAMFGRMLAHAPNHNIEAAAQVAHALSVHEVAVEDDYFTAVDDLNKDREDAGAGHIGETEFAAGLFYQYICINRDLLVSNLSDDKAVARSALRSLVESAVKVAPTGKQSSFASRARASYVLVEKGAEQPRTLSVAFLKPITGKDMLVDAIKTLSQTRKNIDNVYGPCAEDSKEMNAVTGEGKLADVLEFVERCIP